MNLRSALVASLAFLAHANAQPWSQTGGPGAGMVQSFTASGGAVFAGTPGAVYKSTNAGQSWTPSSSGLPSGALFGCMAATSSHTFAGTQSNQLFRSADGGQTWSGASVGLPQAGIIQIARRGEDLFLINGQNGLPGNVGSLFISTNQGDSWTPITTPSQIFTVMPEQNLLFAATVTGVIRSDNGGTSWTPANTGIPISGLVRHILRLDDGTLLAETSNSVFRSTNNGQNWSPSGTGLPSNTVIYDIVRFGPDVFLAAQTFPTFSVFRSVNNGLSWQHADAGLPPGIERFPKALSSIGQTLLIGMLGGAARTESSGALWTDANSGMISSRVTAYTSFNQTMWATVQNSIRVHKLTAGSAGGTWTSSSTGLPTALRMMGLVAADASTLYAGTSDEGVYKSVDGGQTWAPVNNGFPQYNGTAGDQYREAAHLAADGTTIYAGTGFGTEFFNQAFQISGGGVIRTTNGGASWQAINSGFPIIAFNLFNEPVFDPVTALAAIDGVIFAGTSTRGLFRLPAGGSTWTAVTAGFLQCEGSLPTMTGFVKRGKETFAISGGFGCFCACPTGNSVWKSADGGLSWTSAAAGLPELPAASITLAGTDLVVGLRVEVGSTSPTVFRSIDGGASWSALGTGLEGRTVTQLGVIGSAVHAGTDGAGDWVLGPSCYADCDGIGGLTANDFLCFITAYAAGANYANCDGAGGLTSNDFQCFLNAYVAGCN
jgi:photosystem II stability/assembly factor-like uncharacterized protein